MWFGLHKLSTVQLPPGELQRGHAWQPHCHLFDAGASRDRFGGAVHLGHDHRSSQVSVQST